MIRVLSPRCLRVLPGPLDYFELRGRYMRLSATAQRHKFPITPVLTLAKETAPLLVVLPLTDFKLAEQELIRSVFAAKRLT